MKIVLTGSLGHISKPLALQLIAKGHQITIISSKPEKASEIIKLGAIPAIGSLLDAEFLTKTFDGADIIYLMEPPINFFDANPNINESWLNIAIAYKQAIINAEITKVIHLSSIGAHTAEGVGVLKAHNYVENILKQSPADVCIKFMRPVGFYYNMFAFIPAIKNADAIFQNYGGDIKEPWVSPIDIADAIAEEIEKPFDGRSVRYIAGDEVSPNEVSKTLGAAIGKPDLKWIAISNEDFCTNLKKIGMNPVAAQGIAEMNTGRIDGTLYADYEQHKPTLGKVKLTDFAKEFALAYNLKSH